MKIDTMLRPIESTLRRFRALLLAALVIGALIPSWAQARQATPAETVNRLHAALIGSMRQGSAVGFQGRYNALAPTVVDSFNLGLMAQVTVGRQWRRLSAHQQARLTEAFTRMTLVIYATRFDDYSGERFELVSEDKTPRSIVVMTRLIKADGEAVKLDYLLREFDGEWRIIDVLAKGSYSELATRRSEYSSVLKREGFEALIAKLNRKVAELIQDSVVS